MTTVASFPAVQRGPSTREDPIVSGSWTVPEGKTYIFFRVDIPTSDYEDPLNSFELIVQVDNAGAWEQFSAFTWTGGTYTGRDGTVNPPPTKKIPADALVGRAVRIALVVPRRMRIGGLIQSEP
jgi:hypothetical protein